MTANRKPVRWIGSSLKDLMTFPEQVMRRVGYAIAFAQEGTTAETATPMKGFDALVMKITENDAAGTFRTVYTVEFAGAVYVLHAWQKKSKRGRKTDKADVELIKKRLKEAREQHEAEFNQGRRAEGQGAPRRTDRN